MRMIQNVAKYRSANGRRPPPPKVYNPRDIPYYSNFKPNIFRETTSFQPIIFGQAPDFPTKYFRPSTGLSNQIFSAKHQTFQFFLNQPMADFPNNIHKI